MIMRNYCYLCEKEQIRIWRIISTKQLNGRQLSDLRARMKWLIWGFCLRSSLSAMNIQDVLSCQSLLLIRISGLCQRRNARGFARAKLGMALSMSISLPMEDISTISRDLRAKAAHCFSAIAALRSIDARCWQRKRASTSYLRQAAVAEFRSSV